MVKLTELLLLLLLILEAVCLITPVTVVIITWIIYFVITTSIEILKVTFRGFAICVFECNKNKKN